MVLSDQEADYLLEGTIGRHTYSESVSEHGLLPNRHTLVPASMILGLVCVYQMHAVFLDHASAYCGLLIVLWNSAHIGFRLLTTLKLNPIYEQITWMQVAVRPSVPPLTVEAFPVNLASHVNLSSSLEKEDWNAIRKAAYKKAHYRYDMLKLWAND